MIKNIFFLVTFAFLCFIYTKKLKAEEIYCGDGSVGNTVTCTFSEDGKFLVVSGNGNMKNFSYGINLITNHRDLSTVVIEEGVTSVGQVAFIGGTKITSLSLPSTLGYVGKSAFENTGLKNLTLPENIVLGQWAINHNYGLTELILTEGSNANKWSASAMIGTQNSIKTIKCIKTDGSIENDKICLDKLDKFLPTTDGKCKTGADGCLTALSKVGNTCVGKYLTKVGSVGECVTANSCKGGYVVNTKNMQCLPMPEGCLAYNNGCTSCDSVHFKLNDGECDRIRWTPAEAAEVLTDDNNNSVTITFKM